MRTLIIGVSLMALTLAVPVVANADPRQPFASYQSIIHPNPESSMQMHKGFGRVSTIDGAQLTIAHDTIIPGKGIVMYSKYMVTPEQVQGITVGAHIHYQWMQHDGDKVISSISKD
jgi:hypothetical protein